MREAKEGNEIRMPNKQQTLYREPVIFNNPDGEYHKKTSLGLKPQKYSINIVIFCK